ncbi:MAG: protein kinase [Planctomycetota bacterium]|nr:protein kinase [Planctomycetota bacterium]
MEARHFGPYRVIRKLGEGAMGAVYEAVDDQTGKAVAIKLLPSHLATRSGFRARFEIEIETLRKLNHPNIVRIDGWELTTDGTLYYAMELVHGQNLDQRIGKPPPFTWKEVVEIGCQLCKALKHAHDRGIIHRDIKPANIMQADTGAVKLSDFGIARLYGASGLTLEDTPIGTANYMSPEQTEGKKATERSDLYSLGCTFYALLAGRPPFTADSLFQMLKMHRTAEPLPVRQFRTDVPAELDVVILTLLRKEPEQRIANAGTLLKTLQMVLRSQALLHGETLAEEPPEPTDAATPPTRVAPQTRPAPSTPPVSRPGSKPPFKPPSTTGKSNTPPGKPPTNPWTAKSAPPPRSPAPASPPAHADLDATADSTVQPQSGVPTVASSGRTDVKLAATVLGPSTRHGSETDAPPGDPGTPENPSAPATPGTFSRPRTPAPAPSPPAADKGENDSNSTIDKLTTVAPAARNTAVTGAGSAEPNSYEVDDPDVTATADPSTARRPTPTPAGSGKAGAGGATTRRPGSTLARGATAGAGRFVSADEVEELERAAAIREASDERSAAVRAALLRTVAAVVIVAILAIPVWYFFSYRPRTVESVYGRIEAATGPDSRPGDLLDVQDDIVDFLIRAPDDPRAAKVRLLQEEVAVQKLERQLHARSLMRRAMDQNVPMIERLYSDAMSSRWPSCSR